MISYSRCEDFIERMRNIISAHRHFEAHHGHVDTCEDEVLEAIAEAGLTRLDFTELDVAPERFGGDREWHRLLRQVRNNPRNNLFEILKDDD